MSLNHVISTIRELEELSKSIIKMAGDSKIFIFKGDLGAGKTTLIQKMIQHLGYKGEITSPTFSIINEYRIKDNFVYHMDLYRLKSIEEAQDIGIFEYLDSARYCFIEWPELLIPYLDFSFIEININIMENNNRNIIFLKH